MSVSQLGPRGQVSVYLSWLLWILSLAMPAVLQVKICGNASPLPSEEVYGYSLLLFGPFGLLFLQLPAIAWLANPLYFLAQLSLDTLRYKSAALFGVASIVVGALGTWTWFTHSVPADEGGVCREQLFALGIGYWLWIGAMVAVTITASILYRKESLPPTIRGRI